MIEEIIAKRDGKRDLRFKGERIANVSDEWQNESQQNRWSELSIYRTSSGKYVVHKRYRTCWVGESDGDAAVICSSPKEVYDCLVGKDGELSSLSKKLLQKTAEEDAAFPDLTLEDLD